MTSKAESQSPLSFKLFSLSLLFSAAMLVTACGGSSRSTDSSNNDNSQVDDGTGSGDGSGDGSGSGDGTGDGSGGDGTGGDGTGGDGATTGKVSGPLDPVQEQVISGLIGTEIAGQLPAPLNTTVQCTADALNHLLDGPDALLVSAQGLASGADPFTAFNSSQDQWLASLEQFGAQLQSALLTISNRASCDPTAEAPTYLTNVLAGTPLEPVGAELVNFLNTLQQTESDPNLQSVTGVLAPAVADLAAAFDQLPPEAADAPVLGGLLGTVQTALSDVANLLPAVGGYDSAGTASGTETLLNNLLSNALLGVLPVADIEAATGQSFSPEIQAGIDALTAQLGDGVGQVITPLFDQGLNGALSPVLDPVEGLLFLLLQPVGTDPLSGDPVVVDNSTLDSLQGLLSQAVGDGNLDPSSLDALLAVLLAEQANLSLDDLVASLGLPESSSINDLLALVDANNALDLDNLLLQIQSLTSDPFQLDLQSAVDTVIGSLLGLLGDGGLI